MSFIRKELLDELTDQGWIYRKKHPLHNLYIYNYTQKTVYEDYWTVYTRRCRGLILDQDGLIIARPFEKFFNLEDRKDPLPLEKYEITEKQDGSLIIVTKYKNDIIVASRVSFESEHVKKAENLLFNKVKDLSTFKSGTTYLFELISPEFKIVIDYGNVEDLYLLAIINNHKGTELPYERMVSYKELAPFINRHIIKNKDLFHLSELNLPNKEGFVVHFLGESNLRIKIKFPTYKEMHNLLESVSPKNIWNYFYKDREDDLEKLIDCSPSEIKDTIIDYKKKLLKEYQHVEETCKEQYQNVVGSNDTSNRKEVAEVFKQSRYSNILFMMYDNRDYSKFIWKEIKPC